MLKKGEFVVYGSRGVCEVLDITTLNMDGIKKDRLYYILRPYYESESKIFTPVEGNKTAMRKAISKEAAAELVDSISEIDEMSVGGHDQREDCYKEALKSGDCQKLIAIIKMLYMRKKQRVSEGKKILTLDDKYLKMAEQILYSELSVVLGIPKEEMLDYILQKVQN